MTFRTTSNHVGCSHRTLETRIKEITERTVVEEIQACRTERVVHLLDSTGIPIEQVVYCSGFQSYEQMRLVLKFFLGKRQVRFEIAEPVFSLSCQLPFLLVQCGRCIGIVCCDERNMIMVLV